MRHRPLATQSRLHRSLCSAVHFAFLFTVSLAAGCQRPTVAVLTYGPAPAVATNAPANGAVDLSPAVDVLRWRLKRLPCRVALGAPGEIRVEVFEDNTRTLEKIDRLVCSAGTFELRIAANQTDHADLIERAEASQQREIRDESDRLMAWWVPIDPNANEDLLSLQGLAIRETERLGIRCSELLVVNDPYRVDGSLLERASRDVDHQGRPKVNFVLSPKGGKMMHGLTTDNLPDEIHHHTRQLAIILNNRVIAAPAIRSTIAERGEITGNFTEEQVAELVEVLNAGSLPVPLRRIHVSRSGE